MRNIQHHIRSALLIAVCSVLLSACSTKVKSGVLQPGNINTLLKDKPAVSIAEYKTNQEGSFATGAIIDLFVGPIGTIIRATTPTKGELSMIGVNKVNTEKDYISELNIASFNAIQSSLLSNKNINYVDVRNLKIDSCITKNVNDDKSNFLSIRTDNNLAALLFLELEYFVVKGSLKKQIALKTDWTLTDDNDAEAFKARTVVSFQTDEIFPNTEDEAFKDIMLEFAKASADDFLLLLQGKEPLNGNENVFRY